jgi:hypothetical protein
VNKINYIGTHSINRGDRLFEPINIFLIIFSAVAHAASLMVDGKTHRTERPAARMQTYRYSYAFALPLRGPLEFALSNQRPDCIQIGMTSDTDSEVQDAKIHTAGLHPSMNGVIGAVFLMFFERYNEWLKSNCGDPVNWPEPLNFCRIVRNAVAHGGIHFDNARAPTVAWRGLSYGPAQNGRQIIGADILAGDLLGLMFEANDQLDRMGAPVL